MRAESPELAAAMRLLDEAKALGFVFTRTAPGPDAPLLAEVSGDAITVLHTVVTDWEVE